MKWLFRFIKEWIDKENKVWFLGSVKSLFVVYVYGFKVRLVIIDCFFLVIFSRIGVGIV